MNSSANILYFESKKKLRKKVYSRYKYMDLNDTKQPGKPSAWFPEAKHVTIVLIKINVDHSCCVVPEIKPPMSIILRE
jgi:hypothetical protein